MLCIARGLRTDWVDDCHKRARARPIPSQRFSAIGQRPCYGQITLPTCVDTLNRKGVTARIMRSTASAFWRLLIFAGLVKVERHPSTDRRQGSRTLDSDPPHRFSDVDAMPTGEARHYLTSRFKHTATAVSASTQPKRQQMRRERASPCYMTRFDQCPC